MSFLKLEGLKPPEELTAQGVADRILGFLSEEQREEAGQLGELQKVNQDGSISIRFFNQLSVSVYIRMLKYIAFHKRFDEEVEIDLKQDSVESDPKRVRFHIESYADLEKLRDLIQHIFEVRKDEAMGFQVGCCHLYLSCSDARECLNTNNRICDNCLYN